MSAGRIATLSTGRRCRRTASLTAFPDFRETPSREMAEDAAPPMPDNPDDDDHARSKNIQDFCEEIRHTVRPRTAIVCGNDFTSHLVASLDLPAK